MREENNIRVFEHQKLLFSQNGLFKEVHWKTLVKYAAKSNDAYFTILRNGVKFSNYVGVIQAGNLTIEILPKSDFPTTVAENVNNIENPELALWHGALINMLTECRLLKVEKSNKAFLNKSNSSLLEIYLHLFLDELEKLVHEGLLKKYRKSEGNQSALKGQLQFAKHIQQNIVHQERFYVKYTTYDQENILNKILYKTLLTIHKISQNPEIHNKANRLIFSIPELKDIIISEKTFSSISFDRKNERYKDALMISKLILLNFSPDISSGKENVVAILFDMNQLWEEFVFRRIKKEEQAFDIKVHGQSRKDFWQSSDSSYSKKIRPDIVITPNKSQTKSNPIIIDIKWKKIKNFTPSDDDLKQMFVYNLFWKCNKSFLLYPSSSLYESFGNYHYTDSLKKPLCCEAMTATVLDTETQSIKKNFGQEILERILGRKKIEWNDENNITDF